MLRSIAFAFVILATLASVAVAQRADVDRSGNRVPAPSIEGWHLHRDQRPSVPDAEIPNVAPGYGSSSNQFLRWQHATGDWFGVRGNLDDAGIIFETEVTSDWSRVLRGGLNNSQSVHRYLFDTNLTLDTERLGWWSGGVFFFDFQNQNGPNGSEFVGDIQTYSNIDADGRSQLAAAWLEQRFFHDDLRIKIGKMDANEDFAFPLHGQLFLQSSMGFSPTIFPFPSYPDPATGVAAFWSLTDTVNLGYGVLDGALSVGVPTGKRGPSTLFDGTGGLFHVMQVESTWQVQDGRLNGRALLGSWLHTGRFDRFDGTTAKNASGGYVTFDQELYRETASDDDWQGVTAFLQYGIADPAVSSFAQHFGGGLAWTGALSSRDFDVIGLGASWVEVSDAPGANFTADHETSYEFFYQVQLAGWLRVILDMQYIDSPGGQSTIPSAWVSTIRTAVSF